MQSFISMFISGFCFLIIQVIIASRFVPEDDRYLSDNCYARSHLGYKSTVGNTSVYNLEQRLVEPVTYPWDKSHPPWWLWCVPKLLGRMGITCVYHLEQALLKSITTWQPESHVPRWLWCNSRWMDSQVQCTLPYNTGTSYHSFGALVQP